MSTSKFVVIIPARYHSSRLPGKVLAKIQGKEMILHVAQRASQSGAEEVVVATDSEEVASLVSKNGYNVAMTKSDHATGTDRICEVLSDRGWNDEKIIVNLQGDEPKIDPTIIDKTAAILRNNSNVNIATACWLIRNEKDIRDPNLVKVVLDKNNYALYFSRSAIPYNQEQNSPCVFYGHLGLYAYRAYFLKTFTSLDKPAIEKTERLEQLRALWHGHKIACEIIEGAPEPGVDTQKDLERMRRIFEKEE